MVDDVARLLFERFARPWQPLNDVAGFRDAALDILAVVKRDIRAKALEEAARCVEQGTGTKGSYPFEFHRLAAAAIRALQEKGDG